MLKESLLFDINSTRSNKLSCLSLIDCASLCLRRKDKNVKGRCLGFDFTGRLKLWFHMVLWHLVFREGLGDVLSDDYDLIREDLSVEGKDLENKCFFARL